MSSRKRKPKKSKSAESSSAEKSGMADGKNASGKSKSVEAEGSQKSKPSRGKVAKYAILALIVVIVTAIGLWIIDYSGRAPIREARQKLRERDYSYAMTVIDEYLQNHPNDAQALSLKAQAHAGLNQFEQCRTIYEELQGVSTIEDMFAFAKSLTVLEYYAEAFSNWIGVMSKINEGALDKLPVVEKNRYLAEALYFMAACQTALGKLDRALETANDLVDVEGKEAVGRYIRGLVEVKRGNSKVAIDDWKKAIELDPDLKDIPVPPMVFNYEIGILCVEEGLAKEGIQYLEKSLTQNRFQDLDRASYSMEAIGTAFEELGNNEKAEFYWKKQIEFQKQFELQPSLVTREGLANMALAKKEPIVAINYVAPLRASKDLKSSTTYIMQRALTMLGKPEEAKEFQELTRELREQESKINTIREAMKERSDSYWAVVVKAYDFAKEENWGQAAQLLSTVKENLTDDFSIRLLKAINEKSDLPPLSDIDVDIF